jgi:hypothetical protein
MLRFGLIALFVTLAATPSRAEEPLVLYDHGAAATNSTIGLLAPGWPAGPTAIPVGTATHARQDKDLKAALQAGKVDAEADFLETLRYELRKEGYAVTDIAADPKRTTLLAAYPTAGAHRVDSYLDVALLNYGYLAGGIGKDAIYRPWIAAKVKLVSATDGSVLMQETITYNAQADIKNVIAITPDPMYSFKSWSALDADKDLAAEGISHSLRQTAQTIAGLMR